MAERCSKSYPLGSCHRWVETLVLLAAPLALVNVLFWVALSLVGLGRLCGQVLVFGTLISCCASFLGNLSARYRDWNTPLSNIAMNLAYGTACEDGVRFRKWFQHRFVSWKAIARVEYWPDLDRVSLHLYSQFSPIIFVLDSAGKHSITGSTSGFTAVDFISRKLNEAWPGKSTFVISYLPARTGRTGRFVAAVEALPPRRRALVYALLMSLLLTGFFAYIAAYSALHEAYGRQVYLASRVILIWIMCLVAVCSVLLRRTAAKPKGSVQHERPKLRS